MAYFVPKRASEPTFWPFSGLLKAENMGFRVTEDYFSCPQLCKKDLASAVQSIPGYVARCDYLFVLCPASKPEFSAVFLPIEPLWHLFLSCF